MNLVDRALELHGGHDAPPRGAHRHCTRAVVGGDEATVEAQRAGTIASRGLDVAEEELVGADHPLCKLKNVVLSRDWASRSRFAEHEWPIRPAQEVIAVLAGPRPGAVWNLERLELR